MKKHIADQYFNLFGNNLNSKNSLLMIEQYLIFICEPINKYLFQINLLLNLSFDRLKHFSWSSYLHYHLNSSENEKLYQKDHWEI